MKVRDALARLRAAGARPDRTTGSHQIWTLPNGDHVTVVVNHLNSDITQTQLRTIRQAFKRMGQRFDR